MALLAHVGFEGVEAADGRTELAAAREHRPGRVLQCQLSYKWSIRRVHGQHTATYKSTDWMGNVASQKATFTVN